MIVVNFNKDLNCPFSAKRITDIVIQIAKKVRKVKGEVEINVVSDKVLQDLNRLYRGINKTTDVLSFAWQEDLVIKSNNLGQIYISYPQIKKQAKIYGIGIKEEFIRMLIHGLLHLVGYDHVDEKKAKKMFTLQEEILENLDD